MAPVYDRLNDLLSIGRHRAWKRKLVQGVLESKEARQGPVLDVATGTADVAVGLCRAGISPVLGLDPCLGMLREGIRKKRNCDGFIGGTSEELPIPDHSLGGLTCAFGVRNFSDRKRGLLEWARVIRPGGVAGLLEIFPPHTLGRDSWVSTAWKLGVPLAGTLFGRAEGYRYLKDSVESFVSPEVLCSEVEGTGFQLRHREALGPGGMVHLMVFQKNG